MTPAEKKRFFWVMVLIVFFFANLIIVTIFVLHAVLDRTTPRAAPTTMSATAP